MQHLFYFIAHITEPLQSTTSNSRLFYVYDAEVSLPTWPNGVDLGLLAVGVTSWQSSAPLPSWSMSVTPRHITSARAGCLDASGQTIRWWDSPRRALSTADWTGDRRKASVLSSRRVINSLLIFSRLVNRFLIVGLVIIIIIIIIIIYNYI